MIGSDHPLCRLSTAGLRHAARLRHLPADGVARRVYAYHSLPLGRAPHARFRRWSDVETWLGLGGGADWVRVLQGRYTASGDPAGHWMHWRRPDSIGEVRHKLYVSPRPESVPDLFPALVETFNALAVPAFKIGASARALLRPDKLVAYFASRDHLLAAAEELSASCRRLPVHGVPFTAPLDASGVLSWGYDPGVEGGSWRLWIAQAIAHGITRAPVGSLDDTVSHARAALRSAGVDPERWEPLSGPEHEP